MSCLTLADNLMCACSKPLPEEKDVIELLSRELQLVHCEGQASGPEDASLKHTIVRTRTVWGKALSIHDDHRQRTAQVAHDMGTPLQVLLSAQETGDLQTIQLAVENLTQLQRMLMDEAKLQYGVELKPRKGPCKVSDVLKNLHKMMETKLQAAQLELKVKCADELASRQVVTDSVWLMSMLLNFVSNGIKHAQQQVCVRASIQAGGMCRFEVHDDGPGVPAAFQPRLFQPYQCAQAADGGNGLGLMSVMRQSTALGGGCGYKESLKLNGAMFWFEISCPFDLPVSNATTTAAEDELKNMSPKHILLVEDDSECASGIVKMLMGNGHVVSTAEDGREGLRQMQENCFDVVISDVFMPRSDGFNMAQVRPLCPSYIPTNTFAILTYETRCTQALRAWESTRPCGERAPQRLVFASNYSSKDMVEQGFASGADAFLSKPLNVQKLVKVLKGEVECSQNKAFSGSGASCASAVSPSVLLTPEEIAAGMREVEADLHRLEATPTATLAHKVLGTSAVLGLTEVSQYAADLQKRLQNGEDCSQKVSEVIRLFNNNQKELMLQLQLGPTTVAAEGSESISTSQGLGSSGDDERIKRILWAEDSPIIRKTMGRLLEKVQRNEGVKLDVEFVEDGIALLYAVKCSETQVDLILIDEQMPHMTGTEALRAIRTMFNQGELAWSPCPVVMATGDTSQEALERFSQAGAAATLGKPAKLAQLQETLCTYGALK